MCLLSKLSWLPLLNYSLWQSEAQATHGGKDSHAFGVGVIWKKKDKSTSPLARLSLGILCLSSSHCGTSLLRIGFLLGFDIANWIFYGLGKGTYYYFFLVCLFYLALVFMTSEDPYRRFKDRLRFIGFMNNKIKLLLLVELLVGCGFNVVSPKCTWCMVLSASFPFFFSIWTVLRYSKRTLRSQIIVFHFPGELHPLA